MATPRPERDEYMMSIALAVATRTNCMKTPVGAIIVQDYRVRGGGLQRHCRGLPQLLRRRLPAVQER